MRRALALLGARWRWWALPMLGMLALTLLLLWLGQDTTLTPIQYDVPAGPP